MSTARSSEAQAMWLKLETDKAALSAGVAGSRRGFLLSRIKLGEQHLAQLGITDDDINQWKREAILWKVQQAEQRLEQLGIDYDETSKRKEEAELELARFAATIESAGGVAK